MMADVIKVFDVGVDVNENPIDEKQRGNILRLLRNCIKKRI